MIKNEKIQSIADKLLGLSLEMERLFYNESHWKIRNPLLYARKPSLDYFEFLLKNPRKKALFLGMNPGPWGMGQTGVPFGDPAMVKSWLKIDIQITPMEDDIQRVPLLGGSSTRREISGHRLWSFFAQLYPDPNDFFALFGVYNLVPLLFLDQKERNLTPDKLPIRIRKPLEELVVRGMGLLLSVLEVDVLVGVGKYAEKMAQRISHSSKNQRVLVIAHPSPANPAANRGWDDLVKSQLGLNFFPKSKQ